MEEYWIVLLLLALLLILGWLYKLCTRPLNRIRVSEDRVGFSHVKGKAREKAAQVQRLRKMRQKGRTPPSFPNGWYALAESREVSFFLLQLQSFSLMKRLVGSGRRCTPRCSFGRKFCRVPGKRERPSLRHQCLLSGKPFYLI